MPDPDLPELNLKDLSDEYLHGLWEDMAQEYIDEMNVQDDDGEYRSRVHIGDIKVELKKRGLLPEQRQQKFMISIVQQLEAIRPSNPELTKIINEIKDWWETG